MTKKATRYKKPVPLTTLPKVRTGISGLDEITLGGLPAGRPTLICGEAGTGKSLFSLEFLVRGAEEFDEPGVFIAFEEKAIDLEMNVASLGFDLKKLQQQKKIKIDYIHIDRTEIEETGEYDLEGLFIRMDYAIKAIGAKRVVLDTIENLFLGFSNQGILRAELRRLFNWLKQRNITTIITGERGEKTLTRQGLEEYVSDCVIVLDHRVINQISTRRLRIVKYRGSLHGTNEYPFLIDEDGISVLPVTSLQLDKQVSTQKISTGITALDNMLSGKGLYRGSSVLVSGTAGTGKTSIAATFANAACERKERCLYFAFEESPQQIVRNMRSIGIDLQKHIENGYLHFYASRPHLYGLEMHLVAIHKSIRQLKPKVVVLDPITNLISVGSVSEVKAMLVRLIDFLQDEQISVMFTALTLNNVVNEQTDEGVSSLVDSWILIRDIEANGERNRGLYIMKARGMSHSNQVREFVITNNGLDLIEVYLGTSGMLTGSARQAEILQGKTGKLLEEHAIGSRDRELHRKRKILEAKIDNLRTEFESTEEELNRVRTETDLKSQLLSQDRIDLIEFRKRNKTENSPNKKTKK